MLQELAKHHNQLLLMAKKIAKNEAEDVLQETYLKLYESKKKFQDIDFGYIYLTMRSVYIDSLKQSSMKNRTILIDDFSKINLQYSEATYEEKKIDTSKLNAFEKLIVSSLYGVEITNKKNEITQKIEGTSMLNLSRETGIPYRTIYTTVQRIKEKLCKG